MVAGEMLAFSSAGSYPAGTLLNSNFSGTSFSFSTGIGTSTCSPSSTVMLLSVMAWPSASRNSSAALSSIVRSRFSSLSTRATTRATRVKDVSARRACSRSVYSPGMPERETSV